MAGEDCCGKYEGLDYRSGLECVSSQMFNIKRACVKLDRSFAFEMTRRTLITFLDVRVIVLIEDGITFDPPFSTTVRRCCQTGEIDPTSSPYTFSLLVVTNLHCRTKLEQGRSPFFL